MRESNQDTRLAPHQEGTSVVSQLVVDRPSGMRLRPSATRVASHTPALAEEPDEALVRRIVARELGALDIIYERHHQIALGLACRITRDRGVAEDVVQDAFLTLWRQPERYDSQRGSLRSWLLTIVHNRSIDRIRRATAGGGSSELTESIIDERSPDPCELAYEALQREHVRRALDALPVEQRRAIEMSFLHGKTHAEIARQMNCPLGTVKGRIRIGLAKLRTLLPQVEFAPN